MISERYQTISQKIKKALARSGQKHPVTILPVTKGVDLSRINECLAIQKGSGEVPRIAESYLSEFLNKAEFIAPEVERHFIGPVQTGSVGKIARIFDVVHSVHSLEVLKKIEQEAKRLNRRIKVFLQVNISDDQAKFGFSEAEVRGAVQEAGAQLAQVTLVGLMTITKLYDTAEEARGDFAALRGIRDRELPGGELSMGMSADFEVAVEEGATLVRIGRGLFEDAANS